MSNATTNEATQQAKRPQGATRETIGLQAKILKTYPGLVIDKRAALSSSLGDLPIYVRAYLLAQATSPTGRINLKKVCEKIAKGTVDASKKEMFIHRLMEEGQAVLIGNIHLEPKPDKDLHAVQISQLDGVKILVQKNVARELVARHPALITGTVWGSIGLFYSDRQIHLESFTPYQCSMGSEDLRLFREGRRQFNTLEWIDLLLASIGINPQALERANPPAKEMITMFQPAPVDDQDKPLPGFDDTPLLAEPLRDEDGKPVRFDRVSLRKKLLMLCRLLPLCVKNYHLCELGPRQTGKSFTLRELSSRVHLIPGGKISTPQLFYSLSRGAEKAGVFGHFQVVVFDELDKIKLTDPSLSSAMLDYLESGRISRGGRGTTSNCSLVLAGNIEVARNGQGPSSRYQSWLDVLPEGLRDKALIDRLCALLPGWEFPKYTDDVLATGLGFLTDLFGELLSQMRTELDFEQYVEQNVEIDCLLPDGALAKANLRDARAIRKSVTGLFRLLYPDGILDANLDDLILEVAAELRQHVHDQLVKMDEGGEYKPKKLRAKLRIQAKRHRRLRLTSRSEPPPRHHHSSEQAGAEVLQ